MKIRSLTVLAAFLIAGKFSLLAGELPRHQQSKPGVERWIVKTGETIKKPRVVTWDKFIGLKDPPGVTKNDPRYQDKRIPEFPNPLNVKEGDAVSVTCWLHLVAAESDGDYHIQVSNDSADGNNCVVVEVPNPDREFVNSDSLRPLFAAVREWIRTKLFHDGSKEPSLSGNVMTHAPHVTVVGQLFFDDSHVGDPPRGKRNMKASTLWEIHPITSITFAPRSGH